MLGYHGGDVEGVRVVDRRQLERDGKPRREWPAPREIAAQKSIPSGTDAGTDIGMRYGVFGSYSRW